MAWCATWAWEPPPSSGWRDAAKSWLLYLATAVALLAAVLASLLIGAALSVLGLHALNFAFTLAAFAALFAAIFKCELESIADVIAD